MDFAGVVAATLSYDIVEYVIGWDAPRGSRRSILVLARNLSSTTGSILPRWFPGKWVIGQCGCKLTKDKTFVIHLQPGLGHKHWRGAISSSPPCPSKRES